MNSPRSHHHRFLFSLCIKVRQWLWKLPSWREKTAPSAPRWPRARLAQRRAVNPALRAALLEGEIDRCERESSALSEEIASLRAELTQNEGQFAVATDRCELSIEKSRIEEEHLKQTDAALSVVTGRLAAISAALGRIQPLNADLVGALRQKVDVARSQQAEAVRHRKRLEMDVHNTQKMLDGALGHLDELLALSREEEKKTIVDALRSFGSAPPSRKGEIHVEQVLLAAQARPWYSEQGQVAVRRSHTATEESTQEMNSKSNGGAYTEGRQLRPKYTAAAVGSSAATSGGEEQPPRDNSNRVFSLNRIQSSRDI